MYYFRGYMKKCIKTSVRNLQWRIPLERPITLGGKGQILPTGFGPPSRDRVCGPSIGTGVVTLGLNRPRCKADQ